MANLRRELTNVPNMVTMGRVVLIPFVLSFIDNFSPLRSFIASLLYLISAAGDGLDGYLARKRGEVSTLGKFLDPLAGKMKTALQLVAVMMLLIYFRYPALGSGKTVDYHLAGLIVLYISTVVSVVSMAQYMRDFLSVALAQPRTQA